MNVEIFRPDREDERIIQVATKNDKLYALTNFGRIFKKGFDTWTQIELPEFTQEPQPQDY